MDESAASLDPQPIPRVAAQPGQPPAVPAIAVTVCICTFRRPSLRRALETVAGQKLPPGVLLRILVVDNDIEPTAQSMVERFGDELGIEIEYRHAPVGNISIARNAGLEAAGTRWLAFLDDDEHAPEEWLAGLIAARDGANAIFGPSEAIYPEGAPSWIRKGDFHSNRLSSKAGPITTGHTSNVLLDLEFVRRRGLRFEEALGRTGGEDTLFFHAMFRGGGRLAYAPDAVVFEEVVAPRLSLRWILRRKLRAGQVYAMMLRRFDRAAYVRASASATLKILTCLVVASISAFSPSRALWWLARGTFHGGVLSYGLGARIWQEYAGAPSPPHALTPIAFGRDARRRAPPQAAGSARKTG